MVQAASGGSRRFTLERLAARGLLALFLVAAVLYRPSAGAAQSGGALHMLTGSDSGATLTIPTGDTVELRLDTGFNWDVSVSDSSVLRRPPGVLLVREVQGLWNAVAPGTATINATGTKSCPPQTACPALAAVFNATIRVTAGGSSTSVIYVPGWNLVGGPAGTVLPVDAYAWDQRAAEYVPTPAGTPLADGRGYWAYFDAATAITLAPPSRTTMQFSFPPGRWVLLGNPGTRSATVSGADLVFTWDAIRGMYARGGAVAPGAGAWVLSNAGGTVTLQVGP